MIIQNELIPKSKWESLNSKNTYLSPFQTEEGYLFYNSISNYSAKVFAIEEQNDLVALCVVTYQKEKGVKGYFSRRAIVYGGPLIENSENGAPKFEQLLKIIYQDFRKKAIYIELRNNHDYCNYNSTLIKNGWSYHPYLNIQLEIKNKSLDEIVGSFKYNRRREINLSIKEGALYRIADNITEITEVYKILKELYKQKVNRPLPSVEFFEKLFLSEIGKVFVVLHQKKIIGGSFCFYYPNNSIYTMYYCGIRNYHPKIFPTHLAIMAAIVFGIRNNLKTVDLMGAGKSGVEYGVRKYKSEFGGNLIEHGRYVKVCNPFLYFIGKTALNLLKLVKK